MRKKLLENLKQKYIVFVVLAWGIQRLQNQGRTFWWGLEILLHYPVNISLFKVSNRRSPRKFQVPPNFRSPSQNIFCTPLKFGYPLDYIFFLAARNDKSVIIVIIETTWFTLPRLYFSVNVNDQIPNNSWHRQRHTITLLD